MVGENNTDEKAASTNDPPISPLAPETKTPDAQQKASVSSRDAEGTDSKLDCQMVHWTRVIGAFTAALFVAAILQFAEMEITRQSNDRSTADQMAIMRNQAKVMQGQLDAMQFEQRAWVSIEQGIGISIYQPLAFDGKGASIGVEYRFRNTGHVPALHTRWRGKIIALPYTKNIVMEIADQQTTFCNLTKNVPDSILEESIFPQDKIIRKAQTGISTVDLESATTQRNTTEFRHDNFVSLVFLLCIDYRSGNSSEHRQTQYAFFLGVPMEQGFMGDIQPIGNHPDVRLINFNQSAN